MVSGLTGTITKVTVTLTNFSTTFPDNIDMLLVGPTGADAIIMSDVGGNSAVSSGAPVTLTLDDTAALSLPDGGPLAKGTFKPTNVGAGDVFPAPAPAPLGGSALSVFFGRDPNTTWSLYVVDDGAASSGLLAGGWCLTITLAPPCMLTCPANVTQGNDPGQCSAVVNYPAPTSTGTCGTITCDPASGSTFPVGTTTVTCTAQSGDTCTFTVTVNDTESPTITCPADITTGNDPGQCTAVVNFADPTVSDNCPGVGTPTCMPPSGTAFPVGTTTVNCTVQDAAGNTGSSCSFTVTVIDNQPPVVTCPAPISVNNTPNQCGATVTYNVTVSDNCPGASVVCTPASGSFFPVGTTTVNCTGMDAAGNTSSCSFTVTVIDNQPPTIICPENIIITTVNPGDPRVVVNYPPPVTADNCGVASVVCNPPSESEFPLGSTTVVCTVTDTSGNTATCSFTVTVFDVCLQDDTNGSFIAFNSQTGDYLFVRCSDGFQLTGRGTISRPNACTIKLTHNMANQTVQAHINTCTHKGDATFTIVQKKRVTVSSIKDSDTTNSTCSCPSNAVKTER